MQIALMAEQFSLFYLDASVPKLAVRLIVIYRQQPFACHIGSETRNYTLADIDRSLIDARCSSLSTATVGAYGPHMCVSQPSIQRLKFSAGYTNANNSLIYPCLCSQTSFHCNDQLGIICECTAPNPYFLLSHYTHFG